MKKVLIILAVLIIIASSLKDESIIIPNDAIRFRVIASSNTLEDQAMKNKISKNISNKIYDLTKNSKNASTTKKILQENYGYLNNSIREELAKNNVRYSYKLNIGKNYFPQKQYKGIKYDAGYYDSVTVELGNHEGLNWWCIIYPPLCLIDDDVEEVEYTSLVKELLNV